MDNLGTLKDLTEKLNLRDLQLERERSFLQKVLECMPCATIVVAPNGDFIVWNTKAVELTGLDPNKGNVDPDEWSSHFGIFDETGKYLVPEEQLPASMAFRGELCDRKTLVLYNPAYPHGIKVYCSAAPFYEGESVTAAICTFYEACKCD